MMNRLPTNSDIIRRDTIQPMPQESGIDTHKQSKVFPLSESAELAESSGRPETSFKPLSETSTESEISHKWDSSQLADLCDTKGQAYLLGYAIQLFRDGDEAYRTKADIGRDANIPRPTVSENIGLLHDYGIFEAKGNKWLKYRVNHNSDILRLLATAESLMQSMNVDQSDG
jgi:hypothetical protein